MEMNEPVAWMVYTLDGTSVYVTDNPTDFTSEQRALPLYTSPQPQTWVGINEVEYKVVRDGFVKQGKTLRWLVNQIDKRLEEKNTNA